MLKHFVPPLISHTPEWLFRLVYELPNSHEGLITYLGYYLPLQTDNTGLLYSPKHQRLNDLIFDFQIQCWFTVIKITVNNQCIYLESIIKDCNPAPCTSSTNNNLVLILLADQLVFWSFALKNRTRWYDLGGPWKEVYNIFLMLTCLSRGKPLAPCGFGVQRYLFDIFKGEMRRTWGAKAIQAGRDIDVEYIILRFSGLNQLLKQAKQRCTA